MYLGDYCESLTQQGIVIHFLKALQCSSVDIDSKKSLTNLVVMGNDRYIREPLLNFRTDLDVDTDAVECTTYCL